MAAEPPLIAEIRALTADNPCQQTRVAEVAALTARQFYLLSASIALVDRDPVAAIKNFDSDEGRLLTARLRDTMAAMLAEENGLLGARAAAQREDVRLLSWYWQWRARCWSRSAPSRSRCCAATRVASSNHANRSAGSMPSWRTG